MMIRPLITGATGMVGEGVLYECLNHPDVENVLVIGRKPCGHTHAKLREIIHENFFDLTWLTDRIRDFAPTACYFCLGVTSVGKNEETYAHLTYELTLHAAALLKRINPEMTFCYVSGAGTDSTGTGKLMWARIKGRTENELLAMFGNGYMFRPGFMKPTKGLKHTHRLYDWLGWMYPLLKLVAPGTASTLAELGRAMIAVTLNGYPKRVLEVKDIIAAARKPLSS